jgi:hypothetical protein
MSARRGLQRAAQRAHVARVERAARDRDMTADPATLSDNELTAVIYRLQSLRNLDVQPRLAAVVAEKARRLAIDRERA